jgi:hypothetical protein
VTGVSGGVDGGLWIGRGGGFLTVIVPDAGGGPKVDEAIAEAWGGGGEVEEDAMVPGRGAMGIAISVVRLYAGYPSHCFPDRTHLLHCGLVSSHLTLRFLLKKEGRLADARKGSYGRRRLLAGIAAGLDLGSTRSPRLKRLSFVVCRTTWHIVGLPGPQAYLIGCSVAPSFPIIKLDGSSYRIP